MYKGRLDKLLSRLPVEDGDFGFMSCAVYDTAWVAMVAKPTAEGKFWRFPECFQYLLDTQQPDGSWPTYAAPVDGILNTAAALLALKAHQANPYQMTAHGDLEGRTQSAQKALSRLLESWDVETCDHVGFEILVPKTLSLLEEHRIAFRFPGQTALAQLRQKKLAGFKPAYLYSPVKLTALHSLEAFWGEIDYDQVRHHKVGGGYMGSPSSTAACLMGGSSWDEESEAFLQRVLVSGSGQGSGGMPSAFPSTYFELTWVCGPHSQQASEKRNLTSSCFLGGHDTHGGRLHSGRYRQRTRREICPLSHCCYKPTEGLFGILYVLTSLFDHTKGPFSLVAAPGMEADVDDTAKTILALSLLGHPTSHQGLISTFECETHFRTYRRERNPSLSANCNTLVSILGQPNVSDLSSQIIKIASFLDRTWWSDNNLEDKWVRSSPDSRPVSLQPTDKE